MFTCYEISCLFSNIRKRKPTLGLQALQNQMGGCIWPTGYIVYPQVAVRAQALFVAPEPSTGPGLKYSINK